jgi:CheY-like chemotaxis protein/anti-sigma regulatory factor (Ser/Thr protein kinase)
MIANKSYIGDPSRIRQIFLNLCSNAIKFTEEGSIHIDITCEEGKNINEEKVRIAVIDTGIGIAANKLDNIFEKFIQADTSINRKYGGTGLGLAITKTLVEAMGGSIKAESELGKGSSFIVTLTLEKCEIAAEETLPYESFKRVQPHEAQQSLILLVEDYAPNALVAQFFLEDFGYDSEVAVNGHDAIAKFKAGDFSLVLMDVQMHGMNGLDATENIRKWEKQEKRKPIPIIGMTAHALAGDRERCLASGMNDYISKPFNPAELQNTIKKFVKAA